MRTAPAVVFRHPLVAATAELQVPDGRPTDVLVQVAHSSISPGTERWVLTGRMVAPGRPNLASFPHVPGYQAAGTVRSVGSAVETIAPGDRVFSRSCRPPEQWPGSWWGGHVGLHIAPSADVVPLPDSVSMREAASLLLAQVGYNGASKPPIARGAVAVVIGAGLVGQYAGQVLRHRGARVVMSDPCAARLEMAAAHSADEVFDCSNGDLREFVKATYPAGVDVVIETASSRQTVQLAAGLLRRGGQLVLNGYYPPGESQFEWHWFRRKELTLHFADSRTRERLEATLALIRGGQMRVEELITHEFPASRASEAYALLLEPKTDSLGITLNWA